MAKFTFKIQERVGIYRAFYSKECVIKKDKKQCGVIYETSACSGIFKIMFHVKTDDGFENVFLKKTFKSINETKDWIIEKQEILENGFDLHTIED